MIRTNQLEQSLHVMIAVVILLATLLLGIGDRNAILTVLSLAMLALSAYVTDHTGRFRLNQRMADVAALGVVALSALHASRVDRHGQMLAVANLQSYLQYVLLFQRKTPRVYWQLALLSVGQVAIASTLVAGPTFGMILLLYLFAGVVAFALLLLYTESTRFAVAPSGAVALAGAGATPPVTINPRTPKLTGGIATASTSLGLGLLSQTALICATTLAVTASVFFVLPRWNIVNRQSTSDEQLRSIGFSKKVTLGELGEAVNNPDVVMRVQFLRGRGNRPIRLENEPLLRGTLLTRYQRGSWSEGPGGGEVALSTEVRSPLVRQRITIEPMDVGEICCVFPVFSVHPDDRLRVDPNYDHVLRQEDFRTRQIEVEIATNGIVKDYQRVFVPRDEALSRYEVNHLLQMPFGNRERPSLAGLQEIATSALQDQEIDPANRVAAARALSDYLRSSGNYYYSLIAPQRDPDLDPLEDFATLHRVGHCEYFAGALVMMLRSQGIPARMAIGFKGGEWNSVGNYYQIQQLHAHAWVEVYLEPEQFPPEAFEGDENPPPAAWMVLDPTEGTLEEGSASQRVGILGWVRQHLDYAQVLWSNYVVGLNSKRQRQGIYEPIAQVMSATWENLVSPSVWRARMKALSNTHVEAFWEWYRRYWFSWRGGLVAIGFSFFVTGFYVAGKWVWSRVRHWLWPSDSSQDPPVLEMYRRLEAVLRRRGVERSANQTAYEYAVIAGGGLAEDLEYRRLAPLPRRIVEAFYRVRFGGRNLNDQEAAAIEQALVELELAISRPQTRPA